MQAIFSANLRGSSFRYAPRTTTLCLALLALCIPGLAQNAGDPLDVVDYVKLLPLLTDAPEGWQADEAEGSTLDAGDSRIATVHRDYRKGETETDPRTSINILDAGGNPDYINATTAAWDFTAETAEGYSKSIKIDGQPGFEAFEKEGKHGTLWLLVGKRFILEIETQNQDPAALQEWLNRIDLKKLAAVQ